MAASLPRVVLLSPKRAVHDVPSVDDSTRAVVSASMCPTKATHDTTCGVVMSMLTIVRNSDPEATRVALNGSNVDVVDRFVTGKLVTAVPSASV